jgi:hypothetical protein
MKLTQVTSWMSKKDGLMLLISILLKILKKERISLSSPENGFMIKLLQD